MGEGMAEKVKAPESSSGECKGQEELGGKDLSQQQQNPGPAAGEGTGAGGTVLPDQKQEQRAARSGNAVGGSEGQSAARSDNEVEGTDESCGFSTSTRQPFTSLSQIDADKALARALQEQERAYMLLRLGMDGNEVDLSASENEYDESTEDADTNNHEDGSDHENQEDGDEVIGVSDTVPWAVRDHSSDEIDGSQFENDEAFARALQEAENSFVTTRLMALAGIHDSGGENGSESDNSDDMWEDVDPDNMTYEELVALGEAVGTESKGLAEHVVASLPVLTYSCPPHREGTVDIEQCVICRHDYEEGDSLLTLPCKHSYHAECIQQWLTLNKVCPVCSAEVGPA